jgi:hypothetical protein
VWPPDEHLLHPRERGSGLLAEQADIYRHFAPAEKEEAPLFDYLLGDRLRTRLA